MNRTISALLLLLIFAGTVACSSSNDPDNGDDDGSNSFIVNGDGYSNAKFIGDSDDDATRAVEANGAASIRVDGTTNANGEFFTLTMLTKSTQPATYPINSAEGNGMTLEVIKSSGSVTYFSGSGKIVIEGWGGTDGKATGTFDGSFVELSTSEVIVVTEGIFSVEID
jgi:hypothetical protein